MQFIYEAEKNNKFPFHNVLSLRNENIKTMINIELYLNQSSLEPNTWKRL